MNKNLERYVGRNRAFRLPAIGMACLFLAGCQAWPFKPSPKEAPGPEAVETSADAQQQRKPAPEAASIQSALELLQDGEESRAEAVLERLSDKGTDDATARLLLAQIRRPPEELLGNEYEEVEVQPGESLSAIAGRAIDNELLFYALAKLNNVEVPRLLQPGQRLKVPKMAAEPAQTTGTSSSPESEVAAANEAQTRSASEQGSAESDSASGVPLEETARRLFERGRHHQAYAILLSSARANKLPDSGRRLLADVAVSLSQEACRVDDPEQAGKYLRQAEPWLGPAAGDAAFARQQAHVAARTKLSEAEGLLAQEQHAEAFRAMMAALELGGQLSQAHAGRLSRLQSSLGEHYHDLALSAWRDQEVDRAVELWGRVIDINPGFEPARRYLERARRAQRELKNLEGR